MALVGCCPVGMRCLLACLRVLGEIDAFQEPLPLRFPGQFALTHLMIFDMPGNWHQIECVLYGAIFEGQESIGCTPTLSQLG